MWWVSYRGEGRHGLENIGVFDDDGKPREKHPLLLDESPDAAPLKIARGFALVGDDLYIANAWRKDSHIAHYRRHGDTFHFSNVLAETFAPASVAKHLRKKFPNGNFLPGTLVASSQGRLPEVGDAAPVNVPAPQGLKVVLDEHGKPRHSVRGITVHRGHLYVADEAGDAVKIFEVKTGRLVARIKGRKLTKPVHLILNGDTLYIGAAGSGSILAFDIPAKAPQGKLKARTVIDRELKAPSGFAIGPDGDFYVAERLKQRVQRFSAKGKKKATFIAGLPDMPEFLLHVPNRM